MGNFVRRRYKENRNSIMATVSRLLSRNLSNICRNQLFVSTRTVSSCISAKKWNLSNTNQTTSFLQKNNLRKSDLEEVVHQTLSRSVIELCWCSSCTIKST